MKKANQTNSIKRRIIAISLSAITVASFSSATLVSASAATSNATICAAVNMNTSRAMANKVDGDRVEKAAYAAIKTGLDTVICKIAETNIFTNVVVKGLLSGYKTFYEDDDPTVSDDAVLDSIKMLSTQIEANNEKELTEINRGFLDQNIDHYLDSYRVLKGANKDVLAALSDVKDVDNCSVELCNKIIKLTNEYSDFNAAFDKMSSYLSPDATSKSSMLDKYMEYMKTKTTAPQVIKENAEQFADLVVGQYVLAYTMKLTGYSAEVKKTQIENKINSSDSKDVKAKKQKAIDDIINSNKGIVRAKTVTDLKNVVDSVTAFKNSFNSLDSATVTVNGKESHYYSIVDAWAAAVNSNGKATIKLNQDIKTEDFAKITHITTGTSQYCRNGALYLNNANSEITLDLNGYTLVNEKGDAILINNCKSFKATSTATNKGTLSAVKVEGDKSNNSTIDLSNINFNGKIKTAVYVDDSVNKLNIDNCTFKNYTDSAVKLYNRLWDQRNADIKNSVFENNSGSNGGAINNVAFSVGINNCTLKNNQASGNGGAIYFKPHVYTSRFYDILTGSITLNSSTLENNSASEGGALKFDVINDPGKMIECVLSVDKSTFNNNNARSNGGAICSDSVIDVSDSNFSGNCSAGDGGAVCVKSDVYANFNNDNFSNNKCDRDGGAVSIWAHTNAKINNCKMQNNYCGGNGGGIYLGALNMTNHELRNVTITNNTCGNEGGGIYCNTETLAAADVELHNTVIINGNRKTNGADSNARMIYASAKKSILLVFGDFDINGSSIGVSSNSNDTAVVSLSSSRKESYATQARPFHADGGRVARGKIFNGTIYYYK